MIETQIPFSGSANFESRESKIVKTHNCLHCGLLFVSKNVLVLHKKSKHSRPEKVFFRITPGMRTDNVDWRTSENGSLGVFSSLIEDINNYVSTII